MKKSHASTKARRRLGLPNHAIPIPWQSIPHQQIWQRALDQRKLGSRERTGEDSKRHLAKRRLPGLQAEDHWQYLEIECAHVVEALRILRDTYREELTTLGCKPIAEMYWVVFRFAIVPAAAKLLSAASVEYVVATGIDQRLWTSLYGFQVLASEEVERHVGPAPFFSSGEDWPEQARRTIRSEISQETISELTNPGGPFGREAQIRWAARAPWSGREFAQDLRMAEEITLRHKLWDNCRPWTDGLTRLWDTTQEELRQQYRALPDDSRRWEAKYIHLTPLEEIAHKYLQVARRGVGPRSRISPQSWLALARELDQRGISLDEELSGRAGQVLARVRKKGQHIETWEAALNLQMQTTLEDGRRYSLKHLVMKAIHNAAKTASYHLQKAWPRKGL